MEHLLGERVFAVGSLFPASILMEFTCDFTVLLFGAGIFHGACLAFPDCLDVFGGCGKVTFDGGHFDDSVLDCLSSGETNCVHVHNVVDAF
jgi:hypothetical protein